MQTGENHEALRKIFDMIRFSSILVLLLHFYTTCFQALQEWHLTATIVNNIIVNMTTSIRMLHGIHGPKLVSLLLLVISLMGAKGKKSEKQRLTPLLCLLSAGLLFYFLSAWLLEIIAKPTIMAIAYISVTITGYLFFLSGGSRLSRLLFLKLNKDIFNELNETFPQEERLLENEYSVNLPAQYNLKGVIRKSWINIINPFRALLVLGTPGSGKSYFVIRHVITQHIKKGFSFFIYDFKFPDLSRIAYNHLLKEVAAYSIHPKMYFINFDDLSCTHRCNVLYPDSLLDITDATESSRTIMLALNREWIKKAGDFFVESPINFTTAIFWYLKKYKQGKYCTLPH